MEETTPPQWAKSALVFSLVALLALLEFRSIKRHSLSKTIRNLGRLRRRIVFDRLRLLTLLQAFLDFPQVRTYVTFTFSPTPTFPFLMVLLFTNDVVPFERPSVRCTMPNTLVLG